MTMDVREADSRSEKLTYAQFSLQCYSSSVHGYNLRIYDRSIIIYQE